MTISRVRLERFTAFGSLDFKPSPGINAIVGANGTGKTHLMQAAYAACDVSETGTAFAEKLVRVFLPSGRALGRLVRKEPGPARGAVEVHRGALKLRASFSNRAAEASSARITGSVAWTAAPVGSAFIPVKEMLANGPGFRSLYGQREIHVEETCADILDRACLPFLREPLGRARSKLLETLQAAIGGKVAIKNEEFFLRNRHGHLEFTLLAEGMRKLGLLWLLIRNGTLPGGSVLFWDEPEANLNPILFGPLIDVLLQLQRAGVQIFLATHDYALLKGLDLSCTAPRDAVQFHALHRDSKTRNIVCQSFETYLAVHPNPISDAFGDLYDREIRRSLGPVAARGGRASRRSA